MTKEELERMKARNRAWLDFARPQKDEQDGESVDEQEDGADGVTPNNSLSNKDIITCHN
jgi:hypothetical protein